MASEQEIKAVEISKAAEQRDKFILFLRGKVENLSEKESEMYDRIDQANSFIRSWGIQKAREMIQNKYKVSNRTAHRIINDAIHVFGSIHKAEKNYFRMMAVDRIIRALSGIEKSIIREKEDGQPRAITADNAGLLANYASLLGELRRTVGYDKEDDLELPDWDKIGANPVFMTMNPEEAGIQIVEDPEGLKESIIRELFKRSEAEDVEFTEE